MSDLFQKNLVYLRERKGEKQSETAAALDLTRSTYANYETGANLPKADGVAKILGHFGVTFEEMMFSDIEIVHLNKKADMQERGIDVHPNVHPSVHLTGNLAPVPGGESGNFRMPQVITLDTSGDENVVMVPYKARAGYLNGYSDPQFIATLPAYRLPGLNNGTFRIFEVHGVSMYPTLHDRDLAICSFVENLAGIRNDRVYVVVTKNDGIVIKRVINRVDSDNKLILNSDNYKDRDMFPPIICNPEEVLEIWYVTGYMSRQLRPPAEMYTRLIDVEARLTLLERGHRKVEE